nr:zinc finger, CCHC-type [Tanacetum cinerariifolium]
MLINVAISWPRPGSTCAKKNQERSRKSPRTDLKPKNQEKKVLKSIPRVRTKNTIFDPSFQIRLLSATITLIFKAEDPTSFSFNKWYQSLVKNFDLQENHFQYTSLSLSINNKKWKTLNVNGIDCIFVGYAEHSKAYRCYVIEPNDSVSINSIIESRDAIFDEKRFSSIPRPKYIIPNSVESQRDDHSDAVSSEMPEPRKGKRKEAIDDEIGYIMENNTWVISDLPLGFKPLGCKWIFKRKMKVDETIDKFKARLVIHRFRKKEGIDYFDTYAPVARITTIRLLLALAAIKNLVIHQMDVKTVFLNGDLKEEVYMKQPEGFVMSGNEHKSFSLILIHLIKNVIKNVVKRHVEAVAVVEEETVAAVVVAVEVDTVAAVVVEMIATASDGGVSNREAGIRNLSQPRGGPDVPVVPIRISTLPPGHASSEPICSSVSVVYPVLARAQHTDSSNVSGIHARSAENRPPEAPEIHAVNSQEAATVSDQDTLLCNLLHQIMFVVSAPYWWSRWIFKR